VESSPKGNLTRFNRAIKKLKQCLGVGTITRSGTTITLRVRSREFWLSHIIPLFDSFTLRTGRYYDYQIVKEALNLPPSANKIELIHQLKFKLSPETKKYRNKLSPVWKSIFDFDSSIDHPFNVIALNKQLQEALSAVNRTRLEEIIDPYWLAGFIEAEGSFYILSNGKHGFALGQAYDVYVVAAIWSFFNIKAK
jgi:hypothetical protein